MLKLICQIVTFNREPLHPSEYYERIFVKAFSPSLNSVKAVPFKPQDNGESQ